MQHAEHALPLEVSWIWNRVIPFSSSRPGGPFCSCTTSHCASCRPWNSHPKWRCSCCRSRFVFRRSQIDSRLGCPEVLCFYSVLSYEFAKIPWNMLRPLNFPSVLISLQLDEVTRETIAVPVHLYTSDIERRFLNFVRNACCLWWRYWLFSSVSLPDFTGMSSNRLWLPSSLTL
jgi:hypothetical protein